jgi:hypothetical protein
MRILTQTEITDGYRLEVLCLEPINLLNDREINDYINPILYSSIKTNLGRFISETGCLPTCASVSGTVKSKMVNFINKMDDAELYGECRSVKDAYEEDPYMTIVFEGNNYFVHLSSSCKVEDKTGITIHSAKDI